IGERNSITAPEAYADAATFIEEELRKAGYAPRRLTYDPGVNIEAEIRGNDDNASGVAAMLAIARRFAREKPSRTIRFVAFANEEPPFFTTEQMGSWV